MEARAQAHRLRHIHDAVLVGVGTVLADDPRLTVRHPDGRQPLRVVADSTLRTPPDARMLREAGGPVLLATTPRADPVRRDALVAAGADVVAVDDADGQTSLRSLCAELGRRGCISLLAEGGPAILGALFDAALVDKVVAMVAPRIIGGLEAPAAIAGRGVLSLADAGMLRDVEVVPAGPDFVFTGYCSQ